MSDDLIERLIGSDPCQDVGGEPPFEPFDCFAADDRGEDKSRLIKWLTYHPESVPIARCVEPLLLTCSSPNYARNTTIGTALNVSFVR